MQRNLQPLGCIGHGVGMHCLWVLSTFPVPFLQSRAALVRLGFALSAGFHRSRRTVAVRPRQLGAVERPARAGAGAGWGPAHRRCLQTRRTQSRLVGVAVTMRIPGGRTSLLGRISCELGTGDRATRYVKRPSLLQPRFCTAEHMKTE